MPSGKSTRLDYNTLRPHGKPISSGDRYSSMSGPRSERLSEPELKFEPTFKHVEYSQPPEPQIEPESAPLPVNVVGAQRHAKDIKLLKQDNWLVRNGHFMTYIGLYLFTLMVLVRPYEIVPGLQFLASTTIYFAIVTIAIYIPSQIMTESNLTMLSTEVKAILAMTAIALITMPISRDHAMAWDTFSDTYIKAVAIFIVLVNVVRTRKRLMGLVTISLGIGVYLAIETTRRYMAGEFSIEGYRVAVTEVKGIFGNPNEMAMHFIMMIPIAIALGAATKNKSLKLTYFSITGLFLAATLFTQSRGGFLGLISVACVLVWKLGRKSRLNVSLVSIVFGTIFLVIAPGNYGLRLLSIFIPSLDPVGSAGARREGLLTSLLVTARNPWGIGIGNSPLFGARNLQTHNAYTQVSAELGILGLIAYVVFIVSPFRKLGAIERTLYKANELNWFYYVAIGLQASIVGYMVTSFFASVAYNWFIYYLIAYAVAFRRIYSLENGLTEDIKPVSFWDRPAVPST
ncbi:MAG: O-antigen ligase family protein [Pyrinomonadaceae bacterium]